jgi:hypothetical protein
MSKFTKGNHGGPGRPAGSRSAGAAFLDKLGSEAAEELLKTVLDAARGGNMRAAEIVLTRIWPQRRGRPIQLKLPPIKRGRDLVTAQAAVVEAIAAGSITPDEGLAVATVLDAHRRATELAELVERVGSLEAQFDKARRRKPCRDASGSSKSAMIDGCTRHSASASMPPPCGP